MSRALSFGSVAAVYERFRPGYPDELVDEVLAHAGRPVRTALEIGAGTGKATRVFAGRGMAVQGAFEDLSSPRPTTSSSRRLPALDRAGRPGSQGSVPRRRRAPLT